jgi:hypothetical protein
MQGTNDTSNSSLVSRDELIKREWDVINELHKMIKDPDLTLAERLKASSVLAYHINCLNKMLTQRGEKEQFEEQNLGDYIKGVEPRIARHFRRDFKSWKRTLSLKK